MNPCARNILTLAALILIPAGDAETPDSQESGDAGLSFPTLNAALAAGDAVLSSIHGNGSSSGVALEGILQNLTSAQLQLSTRLVPPLYLLSGTESAQNMLATRVYESGARFRVVDDETVVEIPPGASVPIEFNAYCVDFEKDDMEAAAELDLGGR